MSPAAGSVTMKRKLRRRLRRFAATHEHFGLSGVVSVALDEFMTRTASLRVVHFLGLDVGDIRPQPEQPDFERRFLTPGEIRRLSEDRESRLTEAFADRAEGGLDLCYGAIHEGRLANYGWYALGSVEAEHASGAPMGLPPNVAYMYKVFTHPDFRGRRLNATCMAEASAQLAARGVEHVVAIVRWSNEASLRSCEHLGFRRLGHLVVGASGLVRIPTAARTLGIAFGEEAGPALAARRAQADGC